MGIGKDKGTSTDAAEQRRIAEEQLKAKAPEAGIPLSGDEAQRLLHELQVHQIELEMQNAALRQAREQEEKALERYTDLYDFAPVGYFTLERDGAIRAANLTGAGLLGIERSRLTGRRFGLFVTAEARLLFSEFLGKVFAGQGKESCEVTLAAEGNSPRCVQIEAIAFGAGEECRVAVIDITARKRAEEAQREIEELNRTTLESLPAHIAVIDRHGRIIAVNNAWTEFAQNNEATGLAVVAVGANYCDVCRRSAADQDDAEQALAGIEGVLSGTQEQFTMEYPCHSPQQQRWFLMTVVPLGAARGGAVITHVNITARKQAEEALRRKEERLSLALDAARLATWDWHVPSGDVVWNEMHYRVMGYEPGEVQPTYQVFASRVHPDDIDAVQARIRQSITEGRVYTSEFRTLWPDGTIRWLDARGEFDYDANNQPLHSYGVMLDITERKQAEVAVRDSEKLYRAIGESIDYGVWVCAPDGRNVYASESFLRLVGLTREQCADFGWRDVLHPDDAERTVLAWKECVRTEGTWDVEHRIRGVDGQWHPVLARGVPVRNDRGEIIYWAGINLDISRIKYVEEELRLSNEEMTRFIKASVGRELRMIELKKEINELCALSGLPPCYPLDFERE